MRIVVFGEHQRLGALDRDQVIDLQGAYARMLRERGERDAERTAEARVPTRLEAFITTGDAALEAAHAAVEYAGQSDPAEIVHSAGGVKVHAPWPGRRIACMGGNYADHLLGMQGNPGASLESVTVATRAVAQWGFWKVPHAVAGPGESIEYPKRAEYLDYEGEAAIVLGRRGKNISASQLGQYVWGITLLNDWSIRDAPASPGSPRPMSYNLAKNFDGSTSLGPCIVVGELDPGEVEVELRVNGKVRQRYNTRDMIFSFGEALEFLSRDFTFVPGDIISGGTGAGTAADQTRTQPGVARPKDLFLKPGDTVAVKNAAIGTLQNDVVAA
jgi:2-keto-4-pentenoate hydratase/2-oxohepta-3-ene-1,7-dioic acid hydratase in catechol pathway